jgi:hypothetical protein
MHTFQQIKEKSGSVSEEALLKEMGYHNIETGRRTLHKFLQSETLYDWIRGGSFDMKYSSMDFLRRLAKILDLSNDNLKDEIAAAREKEDKILAMKDPWIYVDTHFKRAGQPIFALAIMEGTRRIRIDKERLIDRSLESTLVYVAELIRKHYSQKKGALPMWGKIRSYLYHHTDGSRYLFDTQGSLTLGEEDVTESQAKLTLKGRDIAELLGGV